MTQGIYRIRNTENGWVYIGSSIDIEKRLRVHQYLLRKNKHHAPVLQKIFNAHPDRFVFEIVEIVAHAAQLIVREQHWIDAMNSYGHGYNGKPLAGGNQLGRLISLETRAKISAAKRGKASPMKGKKRSAEFRAKCSAGQRRRTDERNMHAANHFNTGRPLSPERRAKISAAHLGVPCGPMSEEQKAKISAILKAKRMRRSPEHRAAISATQKTRPRGPLSADHRAKIGAAVRLARAAA